MTHEYLRDPQAIYKESFARVRAATDLTGIPPDLTEVVLRLVHACATPDIVPELAWCGQPGLAGQRALNAGAGLIVDCEMVRHGITRRLLPAGNPVVCNLNDPDVPDHAGLLATTRSAAAVDFWQPNLPGAVIAIGNAPTALYRLLEILAINPDAQPAVILAFPVGFVGAAESKDALIAAGLGIPFLTLRGRRGGSALAAAAVNALTAATDAASD